MKIYMPQRNSKSSNSFYIKAIQLIQQLSLLIIIHFTVISYKSSSDLDLKIIITMNLVTFELSRTPFCS